MMSYLGIGCRKDHFDSESRKFEVVIYEDDYKQLCAWVLKKTNIETGGDLFGLWADKHTAVIQFVVGPGKGCRRTSVSFYQDISYLEKVGSYMTQNEGVCHIGEWHSHHQLGLARPSGGDENTVWNNMPTYNLKRFVIFIANIEASRHDGYNVNIGCFLFEVESVDGKERRLPVLQGKFKVLQRENPFCSNRKVLKERNEGAEKDEENKITTKDLKFELETDGSPLVTLPASKKKRRTTPSTDDLKGTSGPKKSKTDGRSADISDGNAQGRENMPPDESETTEHLKDLNIDDGNEEQAGNTVERGKTEKEIEEDASGESQNDVSMEGEEAKSTEETKDKQEANNSEASNEAKPPQADQEKAHQQRDQGQVPPRPLPPLPEQDKALAEEPEIKSGDKNPDTNTSEFETSQENKEEKLSKEPKNKQENSKKSEVDKEARGSGGPPEQKVKAKSQKPTSTSQKPERALPSPPAAEGNAPLKTAGKRGDGTVKMKADQGSGKKAGSSAGSKSKKTQRSK